MKTRKLLPTIVTLAALGATFAAGWFLGARDVATPETEATTSERRVLYWHDPMVPGARFDKPGRSPFMDMDLVPVYADEGTTSDGPPIVTVRPEISNSLGIRTAPVTRGRPTAEMTLPGYVVADARGAAVLVDIYEHASWVKPGNTAIVRVAERPGYEWRAVVESLAPDLDDAARTLKARLRISAGQPAVPATANVQATLRAPATPGQTLTVPRDALIRTATRNTVIVALDAGRFQPVNVVPGAIHGESVEIKRGLKEGDRVVVSGQFLIDSEASLRATFDRLATPSEEAPAHTR